MCVMPHVATVSLPLVWIIGMRPWGAFFMRLQGRMAGGISGGFGHGL